MPGVEKALDEIEQDPERQQLWDEIVRTLHQICETPDTAEVRRHRMSAGLFSPVWRVPVLSGREQQNYAVIWSPDRNDALIHYVGAWPPQ